VVGESGNGLEVARLVERLRPDVLVIDLMMPGLNGLEITRQVKKGSPKTHVIVLSMHRDESYVVEALKNGAAGYVAKDSSVDELFKAVREALAGRHYLGPPLSNSAILGEMPHRCYHCDDTRVITTRICGQFLRIGSRRHERSATNVDHKRPAGSIADPILIAS